MTNKQLAAARRVMSRFPNLTVRKTDETLTPVNGETSGAPVVVTENMSAAEVEGLLRQSCAAGDG